MVLNAYRSAISGGETDEDDSELRNTLMRLPPIKCKTKILVGDDDVVDQHSFFDTALLNAFVGGCSIVPVKGAGHFAHREASNRVVDEFLMR